MDIQEVKQTLCGPMIPVITHLKADLNVDPAAIKNEVSYLVERGIRSGQGVLLAVGAGGDFNMLSIEERKTAARAVVEGAAERVPVVVGAQDTNVNVMIEMARFAEQIGAYGIQVSTPYYYPPSDEDALNVYRAIHAATSQIAIIVYNTPWHDYDIPFRVLDQLCQMERIAALKWSRPENGAAYMKGVARYADRLAVVDNAGMWVMNHLLGGTGFITHLATIWPEHDIAVWKLLQTGDYAAAQQKIKTVNWPWGEFRGKIAQRTSGESPPVKAALDLVGRYGGPSRLPSRTLTEAEREELRQLLLQIGVPAIR